MNSRLRGVSFIALGNFTSEMGRKEEIPCVPKVMQKAMIVQLLL